MLQTTFFQGILWSEVIMKRKRPTERAQSTFFWILSFLLTIAIALFQRLTGPTYPIRGKEILAGRTITYRWITSHEQNRPLPVEIAVSGGEIEATLLYKRYRTRDEWSIRPMTQEGGGTLGAVVPGQPAAGKVEYLVRVRDDSGRLTILHGGKPVVARFKGNVPAGYLLIHIAFMFLGIWFAIRAGLEAMRRGGQPEKLVVWALAVTFIGGMIIGPIVQKYAFGMYWTGFPAGTDLTDNKTLLAIVFWLTAYGLRKKSRWWTVAAAILMVIVYLIPHSAAGSELDYSSNRLKDVHTLNRDIETPGAISSEPGSGYFLRRESGHPQRPEPA
jgi:hypothetical protein